MKKISAGKLVAFGISLLVMSGIVWIFTNNPTSDTHRNLKAQLYESVAYDAAAIQSSVKHNKTASELIEAVANHPYLDNYFSAGTAVESSVVWSSEVSAQTTYQDGLTNKTVRFKACVRYEASLAQQTVRVTPIACADAKALPDTPYGEEVKLDRANPKSAR